MKNLQKFALLTMSVAALTFTSCGDDDDGGSSTPALTAEQKLSGNSFLLVDATEFENGVVVDTYANYDPCDQDDLIIFNADKTGSFDEGATKCDTLDSQSEAFTWRLINDNLLEVRQSFAGATIVQEADITRNDGTNLDLRIEFIDSGDTSLFLETYVKQ